MPTNTLFAQATTGSTVRGGGGTAAVVDGVQNFGARWGEALPDILVALVVFIVGLIVAAIVARVVRQLVVWSHVDSLVQRAGVANDGRQSMQVKVGIADIAAPIARWIIILLTVTLVAQILQWTQITELMNRLIMYIPNVIAALLILVGGYVLGNTIGSMVAGVGTLGRMGRMMGDVVRWSIIVFAAMAALIQLGIAESIILIAFAGVVTMVSLAGGLAFGLGGRDKARDLLSGIDVGNMATGGR